MSCYHPLLGWYAKERNPSGKRSLVFKEVLGDGLPPIKVPCGQCIGCRLEYSRQWAIRCIHEASLHRFNCFITLTYRDAPGSLNKRDFQLFMKRLRKHYSGDRIRYYQCGEYGEKLSRPHYHACLFGFDFPDKYLWNENNGVRLYRSPTLELLWPYGFSTIGDVTFDSAAYVARYMLKKVNGDMAADYYGDRLAPYTTCSRRPGIASGFYQQYKHIIYRDDSVVVNNHEVKPPKFYDNMFDIDNPKAFHSIKAKRACGVNREEQTSSRLRTKEFLLNKRLSELQRRYDND